MATDVIYDGIGDVTGLRSRVHYDDVDGLMHVEHVGDVEPTIERNKAVLNGHGGWASDRTGDMQGGLARHVAAIPPLMMVKLLDMGIDIFSNDPDQQKKFGQILNSNEYMFLRTTPGVV